MNAPNGFAPWPARLADLIAGFPPGWLDRPAAVAGTDVLSYGELRHRATGLAGALRQAGAGPGRRVALSAELGLDLPVAFLATLLTGACCVPVDPELPLPAATTICQLADAELVVGDASARRLAAGRRYVAVTERAALDAPLPVPGHDAGVLCFFTSGSTGRPKGVLHSDESLLSRQRWEQHHLPLAASDRMLFRTSIGFSVIMRELFWPLLLGACSVFAEPRRGRDPEHLLATIDRHKVTVTSTSPSLLSLLLQVWKPGRGRSLRLVLSGGEVLTGTLTEDFRHKLGHAELHNLYGMSEAPTVTHWRCVPGPALPVAPAGFPTDMHVSIVDEQGAPCPPGTPGRMVVAGPGVALGYLNDPAATSTAFDLPAPGASGTRLFRTGDYACVQPDGTIVFTGRAADHVKVNGYRIDLVATETALCDHPLVRQAAVVVRDDADHRSRLVGYVVPEDSAQIRPAEVLRHLRERLPAYSVPTRLMVLDELPMGPTGKTDRSALPVPPSAGPPGPSYAESALSRSERAVLSAFEQVATTDRLSLDVDLFELGLDSLDAIRIAVWLKEQHNLTVDVADFFELSTPRAIAKHLDTRQDGP